MATLSGLRILHKNIAFNTALRASHRHRRIPKRVVDYSRFALQMNFLRFLKGSDRAAVRQLVYDCIEPPNASEDIENKVMDRSMEMPTKRLSLEQIEQKNREQSENQFIGNVAKSEFGNIFKSRQEFNENDYIYRHIHKRLDHFALMGQQLQTLPVKSSITKLEALIQEKSKMPNPQFKTSLDHLISEIKNHIKFMNQQELGILLTAIKNNEEPEFIIVKKTIDIELRWLLKKNVGTYLMDIDLWLYLADTFYECLIKSVFVHVLVHFLAREKEITLSNAQFLHLLFLVILQRDQSLVLLNYEDRILQILDNASFEDVATVSMAYFKTQTPIKNKDIKRKIIERTVEHLPSIDPSQPGYCSIIKSLRYSRDRKSREDIMHLSTKLLDKDNRHIITTSPYNAVHTIKLLESYRLYEPQLLDYLSTTMFNRLKDYRIKDIQYALTSLSNFAYKSLIIDNSLKRKFDILCHEIVTESRRDSDKQYFHLFPLLRAFCMFDYYNDSLIDYVNNLLKNRVIVNHMSRVLEFERSALLVQAATRIEGQKHLDHPNLFKEISANIRREGNLGSVRQDSSIRHLDFILRNTSMTNYLAISKSFGVVSKDLSSSAELRDQTYNFNFQYTLPHQNFADLVISKGYREPGHFDADSLAPRKIPEGQNHCVIIATRGTDYVDGYNRLSGYRQLVTRLLTKIGYIVMHVNLEEPNINTLATKIRARLESG